MRKENIVFRLDVVGQQGEASDGCYYISEIVLIDGSTKRLWAYGLDQIMQPTSPVDLSQVRSLLVSSQTQNAPYQQWTLLRGFLSLSSTIEWLR